MRGSSHPDSARTSRVCSPRSGPARPLRAGAPICNSEVQRPPRVRYGDEVNLVAIIGGIRVTALGKVLNTASKGDSVMVKNMSSNETVQAVIVNKNTARIMLGGI